ncbi:MAG: PorP/SprF family type IX secretion system membrane protein [Microscillaceae bacterium]|nr:PorP/SprF family type IX secretion system membrane protein [Microscillaceae bacterium]
MRFFYTHPILSILKYGLCLIVLSLFFTQNTQAQGDDYNHTQYQNTYLLTNPAMIGMRSESQILFTYRNQPNAVGRNFSNAMLTGVYPLINRKKCHRWGGIGATLIHDQNGDFLETNVGMLAFAYNFQFDQNKLGTNFISLGIQGSIFQRRIDLTDLTTSSQYLNGGFMPGLDINEFNENERQTFGSLTLGGMWYAIDSLQENSAFVGLSFYNINKPQTSFYDALDANLPMHMRLVGGWRILNKPKYSIVPNFKWVRRTANNEVSAGAWLNYRTYKKGEEEDEKPQKTGMASLGLWYNFNDAFVASVQWEQPRYFLTLSFDVPTTRTTNIWQGNNAFEITLGLRFPRKCRPTPYPATPIETLFKLPQADPNPTQLVMQKVTLPPPPPPLKPEPKTKPGLEDGAFRFKFGSNELDDRSKAILDSVNQVLKDNPNVVIDISGHTCDIGSAEGNLTLSKRRTEAVKKYLIDHYGIDPKRISTEAFGESRPLVPNSSEENRVINRRVAYKLRYLDE